MSFSQRQNQSDDSSFPFFSSHPPNPRVSDKSGISKKQDFYAGKGRRAGDKKGGETKLAFPALHEHSGISTFLPVNLSSRDPPHLHRALTADRPVGTAHAHCEHRKGK